MIATKDSIEQQSSDRLPNSRKDYVPGSTYADVSVPLREISLGATKRFDGGIEANESIRVYDTSGPWGDENQSCSVEEGLPGLRRSWILRRNDVEEYPGREVQPRDNGYLTEGHAEYASRREA